MMQVFYDFVRDSFTQAIGCVLNIPLEINPEGMTVYRSDKQARCSKQTRCMKFQQRHRETLLSFHSKS